MNEPTTRRSFLRSAGLGTAAMGIGSVANAAPPNIQGFEEEKAASQPANEWEPVSDRKIRMGIVGYGVCKFGAQFSLQHHPNVDVVAVSDLFPDRCQGLARATWPGTVDDVGRRDTVFDERIFYLSERVHRPR